MTGYLETYRCSIERPQDAGAGRLLAEAGYVSAGSSSRPASCSAGRALPRIERATA